MGKTLTLAIISLLVISGLAYSQEVKEDGIHKEYHENGNLYQEVMYVDGQKQGELKQYTPDGKLEQIFTFKDDVIEGLVQKYHESGKLAHEHNWENGEPDGKGVKTFDYHSNGSLKSEYSYYLGDGFRKEYYDSGQLWKKYDIGEGLVLNFQEFEKNGNIITEQKGAYEGTLKSFYENGKLKNETKFMDGRAVELNMYDEAGNLIPD